MLRKEITVLFQRQIMNQKMKMKVILKRIVKRMMKVKNRMMRVKKKMVLITMKMMMKKNQVKLHIKAKSKIHHNKNQMVVQ
jgi:hypothetical protein